MLSSRYPFITFNLATYNEEKRIGRCLQGINLQDYPKDRIEILISDGGSKDKTLKIAKKFGAKIIHNEKKLPEPGLAKGYRNAKGDYVVFIAADNVLYDKFWLKKLVTPFRDKPQEVYAAFSKVVNDPDDNIWSRYLNEDTDPFNAFVFGNSSHPDKFSKAYPLDYYGKNYLVYKFNTQNYPLIALAQGTILKKGLNRGTKTIFDDILPIINLIEKGKKIAFVHDTGIRHYSLKGFSDFCRKFKKRIYNSIKTNSYSEKEIYVSPQRKIRRYLFIVLGFSLIYPGIVGIYNAIKFNKNHWLLHPIACFVVNYYVIYNLIKVKILKK